MKTNEEDQMPQDQAKQSRIERKKDKMRKQIITVSLDLFRSQGFASTSMEQIADEVDIAKKTLYNYFPEKEAIISSYVQESVDQVKLHLNEFIDSYPNISSCLFALFERTAEEYRSDREIWQVYGAYRMQNMFQPTKRMELRSGLEELFEKILEQAQATGQIRADIPAQYLAQQLEMSYALTVLPWLADPKAVSLNDSLTRCIEVFLNGAKTQY